MKQENNRSFPPYAWLVMLYAMTLLTSCAMPVPTQSRSDFLNIKTKGNLAATKNIGCVPLSKLNNQYTPVDIAHGLTQCIRTEKYEDATKLYALMWAYGKFDTYRVADKSAHQAINILMYQIRSSLSKNEADIEKNNEFAKISHDLKRPGSRFLPEMCREIKQLGPPDYFPDYMILHGMNAVLDAMQKSKDQQMDPLVKNFDATEAWKKILKKSLPCSSFEESVATGINNK